LEAGRVVASYRERRRLRVAESQKRSRAQRRRVVRLDPGQLGEARLKRRGTKCGYRFIERADPRSKLSDGSAHGDP